MLIGELADRTGVPAKTLRYWEAEGLLPAPERTAGGYRDYRPQAVDRVGFIRHAQRAGLTLRQIGEILAVRDGGQAPCRHVAELVEQRLAEVDERLRELRHTRDQLRRLQQRVATLEPGDCPPSTVCVAVQGL